MNFPFSFWNTPKSSETLFTGLRIITGAYGTSLGPGIWTDITDYLKSDVYNNCCIFFPPNNTAPWNDPDPGYLKYAVIDYQLNNDIFTGLRTKEGDFFAIPAPPTNLHIGNLTSSSCDLYWDESQNLYKWNYSNNNWDSVGYNYVSVYRIYTNNTQSHEVLGDSITSLINNLSPNTAYSLYIIAVYSGQENSNYAYLSSIPSQTISFTTPS
jgi:hypothetical protein